MGLGLAGLSAMTAVVADWIGWRLAAAGAALVSLANLGVVAGHVVALAEGMGA